jgi:hypothetical protein
MEITEKQLKAIPEALKKMITITYTVECKLCGKRFTSEDETDARAKLINHIDNKCNVAKFLRYANTKGYKTMAEIAKALEEGKL